MFIGNPTRDPVIVRDEMHYTMMERGSISLARAIEAYRRNAPHGFKRADAMWLMPFDKAKRDVRPIVNDNPDWHDRAPCVCCGVRADRHAEGGCKSYRRGRAA